MFVYKYKNKEYMSWLALRWENKADFHNVSFPVEDKLTDEILLEHGIIRYQYQPPAPPAPPEPSLDEVKAQKIQELTDARNEEEVSPINTSMGTFDWDLLSQSRIHNVMDGSDWSSEREWTRTDGTVATGMRREHFEEMKKRAAVRSDEGFAKLKLLKQMVMDCTTKEEVEAINWRSVEPNEVDERSESKEVDEAQAESPVEE